MTTYHLYLDSPFLDAELAKLKRAAKRERKALELRGTVTVKSVPCEYRATRTGRYVQGRAWISKSAEPVEREALQVVML